VILPPISLLPKLPKGWELSTIVKESYLELYKEFVTEFKLDLKIFKFDERLYLTYKGLDAIFLMVKLVMDKIKGINQERGYVRTINIFSHDYPVVRELATKLFKSSEE